MKHNLILDAGVSLNKEECIYEKKEKNVKIKKFLIKEKKEFYDKGDYVTLSFDNKIIYQDTKTLEKIFFKVWKSFLGKYHKNSTILCIGLGNSNILGDSFGPKVIEKLIATNSYNDFLTIPKVALFCPETIHKTGIPSFALIEMVVKLLKPDVIILLDSYLSKELSNVNRTIEINNCGLIYAQELRSNKMITKDTFQIPVLTIGFPTMYQTKKQLVTKVNLEQDLEIISTVIANSINKSILS